MTCHSREFAGSGRFCALRSTACGRALLLLFLTASVGFAAQRPEIGPKFTGPLRGIMAAYDTRGETAALQRLKLSGVRLRKHGGEQAVPLIVTPEAGVTAAGVSAAWLESRGITVEARSRTWLRVNVPLRLVRTVADDPQVARIELPLRPVPTDCAYGMGNVVSQAVGLTYADSFQAHNFTGSGVKIAVVDAGFLDIDSAIAHGELPASTVQIELPGNDGVSIGSVTDHGTAVAEHAMDMAPGATLYCLQVADQVDMENTRDTLKARGIRIANHSLGWFGASYYNDSGPIDRIVDSSHDVDSVFWAVAAGNEAQAHWCGPWLNASGETTLYFSTVDSALKVTDATDSESVNLILNWNQYSSTQGPATDLYLYLYNKNGALVDSSTDVASPTQGEPVQQLSFIYCTALGPYSVKVVKASGPTAGLNITLFALSESATLTFPSTGAYAGPGCSLGEPADAHGAFTLGAVNQAYYDSSRPPIEGYSSRGPTTDGREKPDLAATDMTSCYVDGGTATASGTSFAAPTAAGAAALLMQRYAPLSIVKVADSLRAWAKDAPAGGWDSAYGAGLLNLKYPSAPPVLAAPTDNSIGLPLLAGLSLSWSTLTGATAYHLQVSTNTSFSTTILDESSLTGAQSTLSTGLAGSTTYYWRAQGEFTACCAGPWSGTWNFSTVPPTVTLISPTNGATNRQVSLDGVWNKVFTGTMIYSGTTTYAVQVSTASTFGTTVINTASLTDTSGALGTLAGDAQYYWHVRATNAAGSVGAWSGAWSFTTISSAPASPVLSLPTNGAGGLATSLTLSWETSAAALTYGVQVASVSSFSTTAWAQSGISGTSVAPTGLSYGNTRYWRVNAVNTLGSSAWSGVWSFSTGVHCTIPLVDTWNMSSLNIHPTDSTTGGIFGNVRGSVLVKDAAGNEYFPAFGIDNIGTFTTGKGYQIYDDSLDTLKLIGSPVNIDSTAIALPDSIWNIVAYLPQANMPIDSALAGIVSRLILAKDNAGDLYFPGFGINTIDTMRVGQGYLVVTGAAASLTYPSSAGAAKRASGIGDALLCLPAPRHYAKHRITGNSAAFAARRVESGGAIAADKCEVGAFDTRGNLVGAGTVVGGLTAFAIWGKDPMTAAKDGCDIAEKIGFRLWDGRNEYPLEVTGGTDPTYGVNKIILASLAVPAPPGRSSFELSRVYPNPFRGSVRIEFAVPALQSAADGEVRIDLYDLRGTLLQHIVNGRFAVGSHAVSWEGRAGSSASPEGSNCYIVRMLAKNFEQRVKLVEIR
jgi:hypothetical protein